ncbi:unnamed protein product, partial [Effrenium voratum]
AMKGLDMRAPRIPGPQPTEDLEAQQSQEVEHLRLAVLEGKQEMQKPNVSDSRMAELQRREQQSLNRLQQLTELQTLQRYALRSLPEPGRSVEDLLADFLLATRCDIRSQLDV